MKGQIGSRLLFFLPGLLLLGSCRARFPVTTDTVTVAATQVSVARGRNLTFIICGGCHYDKERGQFTGKRLKDLPRIAGKIYAANITRSEGDGRTARYSDAELFYLVKTGIALDGRFLPYMMRPQIADADLRDIIAYLRSDDAAVRPADTSAGQTHLSLFGRIGIRLVAKPQPYLKGISPPQAADTLAYGRYLVVMAGCYHCHSAKATNVSYRHPEATKGYLAGGARMRTPEGKVRGPNLTFDAATGIGSYTNADFRKALQAGITPEGRHLRPPMGTFPLTDRQADAIYAYLRSLPPIRHHVK